jgi:hypothetical protein
MSKRAILAATAILFSGLTPVTPSFAFDVDPDVQAALDQYCEDLVPPAEQSPALDSYAESIVEGATTPGGIISSEFISGSEHRHGGSPNIFGGFNLVLDGGSTEFSFDCVTENINANGGSGGVFPNGLQFPGQTTSIENEDTILATGHGVICISPGKNPGTWRQQNDYTGTCSTAIFYSLAGIPDPIPSNSLPLP